MYSGFTESFEILPTFLLNASVAAITEARFAKICGEISKDRESIVRHNPIGTEEEILLWMLLSVLISYLSLSETETPCFSGTPDAHTYKKAIHHVLKNRRETNFDIEKHLSRMLKSKNTSHR
ncbi:MAG: hypothetical protein DWQ47_10350 [Acidobacteria bacterium]|nr:MAG: hypothetical protein DWQ32_12765 [Acidobacteriota bacterium]REJ97985.1 MAG: hypothetical protein DWQ38_15565 [Acidobacteriota bacterium]REK16728.1 MAG: hypothetical protein DWQ43_00610 [Acidobacteriota bacterium]REK42639.1 MAG: hypothetical protein DWQ47_10350 [Acidobacteriota bacterium]